MNDILNKLLSLLESHPKYSKVVGFILVALSILYIALQFTSCGVLRPQVETNKIGAEGVVSKEKNVNRTTKWYYKDPTVESTL